MENRLSICVNDSTGISDVAVICANISSISAETISLLFGEMIRQIAHADGERVGNRAHGNMG